jgi:hypothetical protein
MPSKSIQKNFSLCDQSLGKMSNARLWASENMGRKKNLPKWNIMRHHHVVTIFVLETLLAKICVP